MDALPALPINTARLLLRRTVEDDTEQLYHLSVNPQVAEYLDYSRAIDPQAFRHQLIENASRETLVTVCSADSETSGGIVGMVRIRFRGHTADIGFLIDPDCWGLSYATEAVSSLVRSLLTSVSISRVVAVCDKENTRSARVLEKSGLLFVGTAARLIVCPNLTGTERRDALMYATPQSGFIPAAKRYQ